MEELFPYSFYQPYIFPENTVRGALFHIWNANTLVELTYIYTTDSIFCTTQAIIYSNLMDILRSNCTLFLAPFPTCR
jgi:hypothetical protein